jgi:eukaryotic-like serine/threonine-protein kinase
MRPGSVILTQEGMVFGTPEFMSPEQAQGKTLTPASDIYSLAVILYEVLTGKLPFDAKNAMDYIQLHVTAKPIPLNQRVAGKSFPPLLEQIIDRALSKRPEDRFASAADFASAMQLVLRGATELPPALQLPATLPMAATVPVGAISGKDVQTAAQNLAQGNGSTPMARILAQPAPQPRGPQRAAGSPRTNVGLLFGVAAGFLLLGVVLAVVLMKFVLAPK